MRLHGFCRERREDMKRKKKKWFNQRKNAAKGRSGDAKRVRRRATGCTYTARVSDKSSSTERRKLPSTKRKQEQSKKSTWHFLK